MKTLLIAPGLSLLCILACDTTRQGSGERDTTNAVVDAGPLTRDTDIAPGDGDSDPDTTTDSSSPEEMESIPDSALDNGLHDDDDTNLIMDEDISGSDVPAEDTTSDDADDAQTPAPVTTRSFTEDPAPVLNPERGFYSYVNLLDTTELSWVRAERGHSLVFSYIRLDDFRNRPLDASLLTQLRQGLDRVRAAGLKIILRFAYNFGPYPNSDPDAPKAQILEHITQLQPIMAAHEDIILVVQAGFIGAWGEWHTSTEGLLNDPQDRREILDALLAAVPASRMIQLRYPPYKEEMFGEPLTDAEGWSGTQKARVGHHNDCFLASDTDLGTYPPEEIDFYKSFVAQETAVVPMGGETCQPNAPRSLCDVALEELERLHFSYINSDYHPDVLDGWRSGGCETTIQAKLGHRLTLTEVDLPTTIRPGGHFNLRIALQNQGWASLFNARPVILVLKGEGQEERLTLSDADPRRWMAGQATTLQLTLELPDALPEGRYHLALWLPDLADALRDRPEYAIRFANTETWVDDGLNLLGEFEVDDSATGSRNRDAVSLRKLSP